MVILHYIPLNIISLVLYSYKVEMYIHVGVNAVLVCLHLFLMGLSVQV